MKEPELASGDEGLPLVPLWRENDVYVTEDGERIDLDREQLTAGEIEAARGAGILLCPDEDISAATVERLRETMHVPDAFTRSGWLSEHRVLFMTGDRAVADGLVFRLHPVYGLRVETEA